MDYTDQFRPATTPGSGSPHDRGPKLLDRAPEAIPTRYLKIFTYYMNVDFVERFIVLHGRRVRR